MTPGRSGRLLQVGEMALARERRRQGDGGGSRSNSFVPPAAGSAPLVASTRPELKIEL